MNPATMDYTDIQGLVRFGYRELTEASFLLLRIRNAEAARAWLKTALVSSATKSDVIPLTAMQVGFTREGLQALNIPAGVLAGFSAEFLSGMSEDKSRSRRLGDVGLSSPQNWRWGGPGKVPHMVVMLYGQASQLAMWTQAVQGRYWDSAFEVLDCLPTSNLFGVEPFGFADGISQPSLDWERQIVPKGDLSTYRNLAALGEFLLGYPNEYGQYTDRPLLTEDTAADSGLPAAEDVNGKRDLGRNGTYMVIRQLQQDVRGFWRFLDDQAKSQPQVRQELANAMVGRTSKGEPLIPLGDQTIVGVDPADASLNQFTYLTDPAGTRCPLGAHIRRSNPRNADLPPGTDGLFRQLIHGLGLSTKDYHAEAIASARFHRLLRRGREYGPALPAEQALRNDETESGEHGIYFVCINANLLRQFEFVQNAWMMSTKFGGLTQESDPLLGNREPVQGCPSTDGFSIPQEAGIAARITGLPQFVTVRGGAYFFLPGLRALQYFASLE